MSDANTASGFNYFNNTNGDFNDINSIIEQVLSRRHSITLVRIMAVRPSDGPLGVVDMLPLVHQMNGQGGFMPHSTVYNIPYFRYQGGTSALIIDPVVGDIGLAAMASRDISTVKNTQQAALPATRRSNSFSDGIYFGGLLNGVPTQFIRMDASGIAITTPLPLTVNAQTIALTSNSLTHNGVNISNTHVHGGIVRGGGDTDGPQ